MAISVFRITPVVPTVPDLEAVLTAGNSSRLIDMLIDNAAVTITRGANVLTLDGGLTQFLDATGDLKIKKPANITGAYEQTYQNKNGFIAVTSDIPASSAYFTQPHLAQITGAAATGALGTGSGGGVLTLTRCTDTAGHLLVTCGALPLANQALCTITFGTAFAGVPVVNLTFTTAASSASYSTATNPFINFAATTVNSFQIFTGAVAPAPFAVFSMNYQVIQ